MNWVEVFGVLAAAYHTSVMEWWDVPIIALGEYHRNAVSVLEMTNPFAGGGDEKRGEMSPEQFIAAGRAMGVIT